MTDYGYYSDDNRAPVSTTVSVAGDGLTFTPASSPVDLSAGPELSVNFVSNSVATSDSKEPNNTPANADANAALPLNYNSVTAGDSLTVDSTADPVDYYSITPAAGKGLRVRVDYILNGGFNTPLNIGLYDNLQNPVSDIGTDANGEELRLQTPASGNAYYLEVQAPGNTDTRTYQYRLSVEVYDPVVLDYNATFGAQPLQNARIYTRDNAGLSFGSSVTDPTGSAPGLLCKSGETILSEIFRYGMDIDRSTKATVIGANPVTVNFAADPAQSNDSGENNDSPVGIASAATLPLTISATVDPDDDFRDCYKFTTTDANPVRVQMLQSSSTIAYSLTLYDGVGTYLEDGTVDPAKGPGYLATNGPGDYVLQVTNLPEPAQYTVQIDTAPLEGSLGGTVLSAGNPLLNSVVYCTELDRTVNCDAGTGAYTFGPVLPGTYTLTAIHGGYFPDQASKQGVVAAANVTVNFTLTASGIDQNEPGDNVMAGATGPLVSGQFSSPRTIGDGADSDDWYKFTATAGQLCEARVVWAHGNTMKATVNLYDSASNYIGQGSGSSPDESYFTFFAPANDTYYVDVTGGPVDYKIEVSAQ